MGNNDDKLVSLSGAPIFRYTDGEKEWEAPQGEECIEEISAHIEKHIGKIETVLHEIISDTVHIDVHYVKPNENRPFHTLISSGMSDLPMKTPDDVTAPKYIELMITLPMEWKIDQASFDDENWYWPVRLLKFLARFPHKYDSWLAWGHTMPNDDPPVPYADNTKLCGMIILPSIIVPQDFYELPIDEEKTIHFYSIVPLYNEEMEFKLRNGTDQLLEKFDKYEINEIVDITRKNVAKKRFGLF